MSTFTFRPLTRDDFALLMRWLADPDVLRWWQHDASAEGVERDFGPGIDGHEPGEDLVAELDGRPIGLVQRSLVAAYPEDLTAFTDILGEVAPHVHELDYLIGAATDRGRGFGAQMLAAVAAETFVRFPDTPYVLVSVVEANRRSWRMLEKAGFQVVGEGDLEPDNPIDPPLHVVLRLDRPAGPVTP